MRFILGVKPKWMHPLSYSKNHVCLELNWMQFQKSNHEQLVQSCVYCYEIQWAWKIKRKEKGTQLFPWVLLKKRRCRGQGMASVPQSCFQKSSKWRSKWRSYIVILKVLSINSYGLRICSIKQLFGAGDSLWNQEFLFDFEIKKLSLISGRLCLKSCLRIVQSYSKDIYGLLMKTQTSWWCSLTITMCHQKGNWMGYHPKTG